MAITDYSTSAASNTVLGTIPVGPGMKRADVNDAIQQLMADIAGLPSSSGSTLVTFLPSGTGAVAITVQTKLRALPVTVGDFNTLQAAIDAVSTAGGGIVYLHGQTVNLTTSLIVKDDVTLDLGGGKLAFTLAGSLEYGVRLRNRAHVCNGEIEITSASAPASSAGYHAPIIVGPFYGDGGTVGSPSTDEGVTGWSAKNLKISTNRDGKVGIQIIGGANNGLIENIEVPDNSSMFGVVHLDWGYVGTINSANIAASRVNFDAGTAYTTHPHNIIIRNIKTGSLTRTKTGTDTGSHVVRLSGVYNVRVENVRAKQCTYAGVRHTAGDVGFEFAPAAIKHLACKGIVIEGVALENTTDSWAVYCDSYADNVASAVSGSGYSPLIDPLHETDIEFRHVTAKGSAGASVTPGLYIIQLRGGKFIDCDIQGYSHGCLVDKYVYGTQIHGRFYKNRGHGIYIHHGTNKPEDVCVLSGTHCYQNGQDAGFSQPCGIAIESSIRTRVDGALLGHRTAASETTQVNGIRVVATTAVDVEIENCHVFSVDTGGGVGYALLTNTDYGYIKLFRNNTAAAAITTKLNGVNILPINRFLATDGTEVGHFTASRFALTADTTPTAGTWVVGDTIFHSNPTGGNTGTRCTAAGSPGTWGLF